MKDISDWNGTRCECIWGQNVAIRVGIRTAASTVGIQAVWVDAERLSFADTYVSTGFTDTPDHFVRARDVINAFAGLRMLVETRKAGNRLALTGAGVGIEVLVTWANQ